MPQISDDLRQRSFENEQQRVLVNVLYTSAFVKKASATVLRPHGFTWQQFNLLRILRGQAGRVATVTLLQERMLDPQSNASRLVDKLEDKGYVERAASPRDRRCVRVTLTLAGSDAIERASAAMHEFLAGIGGGLTDAEMSALSQGLDRFRDSLRDYLADAPEHGDTCR